MERTVSVLAAFLTALPSARLNTYIHSLLGSTVRQLVRTEIVSARKHRRFLFNSNQFVFFV